MRLALTAVMLTAMFLLGGCEKEEAKTPAPYALTADAMGRYCGMNVLEHPGPKGQVILRDIPEPIWFSSARDTVAFTMLPEEPKDIAAIYVSDMGSAKSWEDPGAENWIDAKKAFYVIRSSVKSGMGAEEAVPFLTESAAREFAAKNGGQVTGFTDLPEDYVLGTDAGDQDVGLDIDSRGRGQTHG
ncbi:nitrous oxide reductase accessory protein NosL [Sinorhizobium mexicanum]|uniref:Copper resistance protein CopZ n=1 Tax=Sinorhizobium mexicanum TaxID=375549 RepID=A0A859R782_9HYPH|nr:nitrous oxide reductase accessory protein NosL [Sinorhizobium mexicanum]MBP1886038.1 copper chaperone NosL [Sinorhizobium mexicanum]QLL65338.1 copper resistance protein CopZ [Sinorhizobium mexicanum]